MDRGSSSGSTAEKAAEPQRIVDRDDDREPSCWGQVELITHFSRRVNDAAQSQLFRFFMAGLACAKRGLAYQRLGERQRRSEAWCTLRAHCIFACFSKAFSRRLSSRAFSATHDVRTHLFRRRPLPCVPPPFWPLVSRPSCPFSTCRARGALSGAGFIVLPLAHSCHVVGGPTRRRARFPPSTAAPRPSPRESVQPRLRWPLWSTTARRTPTPVSCAACRAPCLPVRPRPESTWHARFALCAAGGGLARARAGVRVRSRTLCALALATARAPACDLRWRVGVVGPHSPRLRAPPRLAPSFALPSPPFLRSDGPDHRH